MGKLSARLLSGREALARLAGRRAFESYIRRRRVPTTLAALSAAASDEQKFLDLCASLSTKALSNGKATTHYTWRTVGDDKVRDAHAALAGQVFSWSSPPATGHPGAEIEKVSATTYCVYDVKTGTSGLSRNRLLEILEKLPKGVLVYIMEVRPFE